jgi:hypothetical protein
MTTHRSSVVNGLRAWLKSQPDWVPALFFTGALYSLGFVAVVIVGFVTGSWVLLLCLLTAGVAAVLVMGAMVLFVEWLLS